MYENEYLVNASKDLSKYPNQIYQALLHFLNQKYKAIEIKITSRNQVYNRIGYLRGPSTEALLTIEIQPHNSTIAGRRFLQRSLAVNIDGEFQRFLMLSSEEGLAILRIESELFIDATFRVTPPPFLQCLIVMSFNLSPNLFVPCVLLTKTGLNLGNISPEYGLRNIRLGYGKTNDKQKSSARAQTIA
ncbi:hypothetical protein HZS_6796 [Henneguya salminicola]|nr:hypothetical protein HZS_6796 [Henneguya salminicola]